MPRQALRPGPERSVEVGKHADPPGHWTVLSTQPSVGVQLTLLVWSLPAVTVVAGPQSTE